MRTGSVGIHEHLWEGVMSSVECKPKLFLTAVHNGGICAVRITSTQSGITFLTLLARGSPIYTHGMSSTRVVQYRARL
jgi:hypothetical protein